MISSILSVEVTSNNGQQLSLYVTEDIQGKQLNRQVALCWQEMIIILFKYFILIIFVESKYFNNYFVIVRMFWSRTANCYNGTCTKWSATKRPVYMTEKYKSNWSIRAPLTRALDK